MLLVLLVILCVFIVYVVGIQEPKNEASTKDNMTSDCNDILPEIYVDRDVLKPLVLDCISRDYEDPPIYDKVYEINGTIFREDVWKDNGTLSEFEIHTTNTNGEMEVKIRDTADVNLPVSIQETPYGLIINSNMLLTVSQWNTLVEQDDTRQCVVCDTKISSTIEHIDSVVHLRNLEKYQPLKKFDLSITRLIDDTYHCGVCNEAFNRNAEDEHFDSKSHEENMLFATNRASDVLYDFDIHDQYRNSDLGNTDNGNKNNDFYHFNRNRLLSLSDTSGFDSAEGFYDYDVDDNVPYFTDNDNESNDNGSTSNDNEYNVIDNVIDNSEYNQPNYVSYASMTKKAAATPDYLYVTIFGKIMKIKFDHWHMLSSFKSSKTNQIYCMVCKKYYPTTQKVQHCAKKTHLDKLKSYKLVEKYKKYIIRNMDFKYYHCGMCNKLQLIEQIDQHIDSKHKRNVTPALHSDVFSKNNDNNDANNTRNTGNDKFVTLPLPKTRQNVTTPEVKDTTNTDTDVNINNENVLNTNTEYQVTATQTNKNSSNDTISNARKTDNVITPTNNDNDNACEINNESPIYNDIVINQFGFMIKVSYISYNFITKDQNFYHCHICRVTANDKDMTRHVTEQKHNIGIVSGIQFKENYGIHLIRMIGILDHCAVCNVIFNMEHTWTHILDPNHIHNLSKALAINASQNNMNSVMNLPIIDSNRHAIHPSTMGVNQPAMHQPAMAMNRPAMHPPTMGINPLPMHPPIFGMNQPPIFMHQPVLPPTIPLQPGPSGINLNQMSANMNQQAIIQTTTNMNQRTTIMPNLEMNRSTNIKSDKNQQKTIESQRINQPRTDMNQRATNESKIESQIESLHDMFEMNDSIDDVDDDIEYFKERFVYLKFRNTFVQVGLSSYHSLIKIGDGSVYCFVCSLHVYGSMKRHVESTNHANCMDECKFISKYERHLLRQMFLNYHCSVCNVIFTRKDINKHITWPVHLQDHKTDKKARKRDLKSGGKLITISFQNEAIYLNGKETEIKVLVRLEVKANSANMENLQKKNKIIIVDNKVLKISWDAYHGLGKNKSGHRCVLCQSDVRGYELSAHIGGEHHREMLDKFRTQHLPHLLREINESTLNCVICNVEVANKEHIIGDHIYGKKHKKTYDDLLLDSCTVDSYADCNDDVLNL